MREQELTDNAIEPPRRRTDDTSHNTMLRFCHTKTSSAWGNHIILSIHEVRKGCKGIPLSSGIPCKSAT